MASLKETKTRIASVKSTLQITSAMKMVAAAKLHRAQQAIGNMLPYQEKLNEILQDLLAGKGVREAIDSPLLQAGASDRIARDGEILGKVDSPSTPALEAVGGTGDLVTGILTGLLASGLPLREACFGAARAARLAGSLAAPTPATQIAEILPFVPEALAGTGLCPFPGADV